ncbi:MAG: hypothetical protein IJV35_04370 [Neisseriaceae bacterium]|nr:hypothetical protein [Neisseriaceae bacterium]
MPFLRIGYPESIFKFALSGSFKNTFRRRQIAISNLLLTAISQRMCIALVAITTPCLWHGSQ